MRNGLANLAWLHQFATKARGPAQRVGIPDVSFSVAVASGKGGVGKSTTAGSQLTALNICVKFAIFLDSLTCRSRRAYTVWRICRGSSQFCSCAHFNKSILVLVCPLSSPSPSTSCLAVNIAVALAQDRTRSVGLLDADVHGPSIPRMMNLRGQPETRPGKFLRLFTGCGKRMKRGRRAQFSPAKNKN